MKIGFDLLVISLGGACGALFRHFITSSATILFKGNFPWGILLTNIIGCLLIGLIIGGEHDQKSEAIRLGFGIGFLGSLTTFSTFSADTVKHALDGNWVIAGSNVAANLIICLLAVAVGIAISRRLFN